MNTTSTVVIAGRLRGPDGRPAEYRLRILATLPPAPAGERWVGPVEPYLLERDDDHPGPWALGRAGAEGTDCYTPTAVWAPAPRPTAVWETDEQWTARHTPGVVERATTDGGRAVVRTRKGWWVAVPADRPSELACRVVDAAASQGVAAVEVDERGRRQPVRDHWGSAGPQWRLPNLVLGRDGDAPVVVWCPFRPGSRAYHDTLRAAGVPATAATVGCVGLRVAR